MEYKTLYDGTVVQSTGFGTFRIQKSETYNAVYEAIKAGYRTIDTAEGYNNEEEVGLGIQKAISEGLVKREDLFITTKLSPHHINGYEETFKYFNISLNKLGLDYLDLYLIHYPNPTKDDSWKKMNADIWRAMEELQAQGKLRHLGVSNFMIYHLEELFKTAKVKPVVNQIEMSPVWQQKQLVEFCKNNNIEIFSWRPTINQKWVFDKDFMQELPKKYNKSLHQILLRWNLQKDCVPLCKTVNPTRMKENLEIFDFELSKEDMDLLDGLQCSTDVLPDFSHLLWSLWENKLNKTYVRKEVYNLFGFIPILKIKQDINGVAKYFIFGFIPFLKKQPINNSHDRLYLFNFIKIGKTKKIFATYKQVKWIPENNIEPPRKVKKNKWNPLKSRTIDDIVQRANFWQEKYQKNPLFKAYLSLRRNLFGKVSISSLDVHITTHCTLKCKDCSHFIPYYNQNDNFTLTFDEFKKNIDAILKHIDRIYNLNILGGEPFLNKEIVEILDYANKKKQIKAIRIHTNGTIVPDDEILEKIKELKKVTVYISNYKSNKTIKILKNEELIAKLKEYKIHTQVEKEVRFWKKMARINLEQNLSESDLANNYYYCASKDCVLLSKNKIYPCAPAKYIELISDGNRIGCKDFIDLSDKKINKKTFVEFFKCSKYDVCNNCDFSLRERGVIPAIQLNKGR